MSDKFKEVASGITLKPIPGVPTNPRNGDIYYSADDLQFKKYENGSWSPLSSSGTGVTYSITAGENLAANDAVYVSEGGSVDSGRTAGLAYKLDATNVVRAKYAGLAVSAILSTASGLAQIGGQLNGFSSLTPGQALYASVSTPGSYQSTLPVLDTQFIILLGVCTSATTVVLSGEPGSGTAVTDISGSLNFLTNFGAENTTDGWITYNDASGATPVDMTGGSPSITLSRTVTAGEVLNGAGSFKIVKGASNRQGDGISFLANLPKGYRTKPFVVKFPFNVISGSLALGDLQVFVYDVTNSALLARYNNTLSGSQGVVTASFTPVSTTAQIRIGLHFATTVTTAVTLSFDDVMVLPVDLPLFLNPGTDGQVLVADSSQLLGVKWTTIGQTVPTGASLKWWSKNLPATYLWEDGAAVSRTTYGALFAEIGVAHGIGDGSTTFNLPNSLGRMDRHVDGAAGLDPDKTTRVAAISGTQSITGGATTSGSSTITVGSTVNLAPGFTVTGTGIPANSVVRVVLSGTTFTLGNLGDTANVNATATNSGLTFTCSKSATGNYTGSVQADAAQGHIHGAISTAGGGGTGTPIASWTVGGANAGNNSNFGYTGTPFSDTVHGAPRTSFENRPVNINCRWIIKT